ncbi:MAG: N-acetylmuramate alpha-1-phosphate uridylyltransferase MurU [Pseudomonadota bacterium]
MANLATAMILAAGRGERMRPLTDDLPKPLLELNQKALIEYHLEGLVAAGVKTVVINVCWLGECIRQRLGDGSRYNLNILYSEESEALETAGGILQAMPLLDTEFIVVNADIYTDYGFDNLTLVDSDAHLVLVPNPEQNAAGDFALEGDRLRNQGDVKYTFSGVAKYRKCFFNGLVSGKQALAPWLRKAARNNQVTAEVYQGQWHDVGTVERLEHLRQKVLNKI